MCYDVFVMLINQYQFPAFVRDEQLLLVKYLATEEAVDAFGLLQVTAISVAPLSIKIRNKRSTKHSPPS